MDVSESPLGGWRAALEGLWPAGLALLQVRIVVHWRGAEVEPYEWCQYLLLGMLFLGFLLLQWSIGRLWPRAHAAMSGLRLTLGIYGVVTCVNFGIDQAVLSILAVAGAHGLVLGILAAVRKVRGSSGGMPRAATGARRPRLDPFGGGLEAAVGLGILAISWLIAARMVWWGPAADWVRGSPRAMTAFVIALLLTSANLSRLGEAPADRRSRLSIALSLVGLVVIVLASLRVDTLGAGGPAHPLQDDGLIAFHHWGAIVGTGELIRRGGWLLWDVPSQYGFLNALIVAWLPAENVWRSFYLVNAALLSLSGGFIFLTLRSLRTGPMNFPFALAVALAAIFMIPGSPLKGTTIGPQVTPAVGAYRFVFCYALLAVLLLESRVAPRSGSDRRLPALGCVVWLIGTLWSCESAAYCAVIWLPAYVVMAWRRATMRFPDPEGRWARARMMAAWAARPAILLGAALAAISLFYIARLGHAPDWRAYADFVLAMKIFALPIEPGGVVLVLLLAFCVLSVLVAAHAGRGGDLGGLSLALGAWGMLWAGASYFVGRSHEVNGMNINGLTFAAIAVGLVLTRHAGPRLARVAPTVRLATAPVLVALLTTTFGLDGQVEAQVKAMRRGYRREVERLLPAADDTLARLLDRAGVRRRDPVAIACKLSDRVRAGQLMPARRVSDPDGPRDRALVHETWAPPYVLLMVLPPDRQEVYLRRSAERHDGGRLVLQRDQEVSGSYLDMLLKHYRPVEWQEDERWRVTRLEAGAIRR
jgi:hypothetical protein